MKVLSVGLWALAIAAANAENPTNGTVLSNQERDRRLAPYQKEQMWTQWYDGDNPSGLGDGERLTDPDPPPCNGEMPVDIQCETVDGVDHRLTGDVLTCSPSEGLVCLNKDQEDGNICQDYKVRFLCPDMWSQWYNGDIPSGLGDGERLTDPDPPPCDGNMPVDIQCETAGGIDHRLTGDVLTCSPPEGLVCLNDNQKCQDYKVRFQCPDPNPDPDEQMWTQWYNGDNPSGLGDGERLSDYVPLPCDGDMPVDIQCETVDGMDHMLTGDVLTCSSSEGLLCLNNDQKCQDYKVRFLCPDPDGQMWTQWYNGDNPSGLGDGERLTDYDPPPCDGDMPVDIQCETVDGVDHRLTGDVLTCSPPEGLVCLNNDQNCQDYKVRFQCPTNYNSSPSMRPSVSSVPSSRPRPSPGPTKQAKKLPKKTFKKKAKKPKGMGMMMNNRRLVRVVARKD